MASRVVMPKLTDTMEEGVLLAWKKREGDQVQAGDALAEIETDKAIMDLEAFASGILRKILVQDGATVMSGTLIGVIGGADEDITSALTDTITAAPSVGGRNEDKRAACCRSGTRHTREFRGNSCYRLTPRESACCRPGNRSLHHHWNRSRRANRGRRCRESTDAANADAAGRNRPTAEPDAESHRASDDTEQSAGAAFLSDERDRYGAGRAVPRSVQTEPNHASLRHRLADQSRSDRAHPPSGHQCVIHRPCHQAACTHRYRHRRRHR